MASRYNSFDSRSSTSSHFSDPSSSTELKHFSFKPNSSSRALVKSKKSDHNLGTMVKKFMERKSSAPASMRAKVSAAGKGAVGLVIPSDLIVEDLKKAARKGSNFTALHRKLFGKEKEKEKEKKEVKALTEVKGNTRTLAMVLRSERELLSLNKDQELENARLNSLLEEKNTEVEKLKDLCLKQREEIKALKSAILFPDAMNSQLQELLEKQGSELKQAKQIIPNLQRQVSSLTGQLQCLAVDLAEVKADKYSAAKARFQHHGSSPRTPTYDDEEAANSLEFSSEDPITPGSTEDMFLKDLNPCLTPYCVKTKSKEYETMGYESPLDQSISTNNTPMHGELGYGSCSRKLSRSSDYCQNSKKGSTMTRTTRRSDDNKGTYGRKMQQRVF